MADRLKGLRIALAGPRKAEEMAGMVTKMGGVPVLRPAQGTVFLDNDELRRGLLDWLDAPPDWAILTTGMGLDALFAMAETLDGEERLKGALSRSKIAARGYKTVNALKKRGLTPDVRDDDGSTSGLIRQLEPYDFEGKSVVLQLHGDPAPRLTEWLGKAGAQTRQILPYRHVPPADEELDALLADITGGGVDAVAFTSAPQFRFLIGRARAAGQLEQLLAALEGPVLAVAVGRITADSLVEEGVKRIIVPEQERMGGMFLELGRYLESRG